MTIFQQPLSRFTWMSHHELVYIHFSLCNTHTTSLLSMCAHSAEPLNLPPFSHMCIGSPCLANAVVLSLWPMISCLKNKQLGPNKNHLRELEFHSTDQRKMDEIQPCGELNIQGRADHHSREGQKSKMAHEEGTVLPWREPQFACALTMTVEEVAKQRKQ